MVDTFGISAMAITVLLLLAAFYIIFKFIRHGEERKQDYEMNAEYGLSSADVFKKEEEFLNSFTRPMIDDAKEDMDNAFESIKSGIGLYDHGAFVEASDEFHSAIKDIDLAIQKLRDVLGLIENPENKDAHEARDLLNESKKFRKDLEDMENACDAMINGDIEGAKVFLSNKDMLLKKITLKK
jgi:tetratricopeptide (TPR) repeat protein